MWNRQRLILAALCCAALPAVAAPDPVPCASDPKASGLNARMENMKRQMDRIEWTTDRSEQRHLMEIHMKTMHEGMRELRKREAGEGCRMEMMHAMMEQMMRHHLAEQDSAAR